jgi:pseudaminic acid cytidylyltransferase
MGNNVAIITARGGSKRIPRKNIKNFLGKPIIQYSIEAALDSGCFDEIMVSTDDQEIAELAIKLGAKVPFLRSKEKSDDFSTTAQVVEEVIENYALINQKFEFCCCIYPTAPFITSTKLKTAYSLLESSKASSLVPIVTFGFPILRSFKIEEGLIKMNWPENINTRSQDLRPAYHDCGQFYFLRTDDFMISKKLFSEKTIPMIMPESEVQDIDTEEDWKIAEIKYTFLLEKLKNG